MALSTLQGFVLQPASPDDVYPMAKVYCSAFANDYHYSVNFPKDTCNQASLEQWLAERFASMFNKPGVFQFVVKELSTGKLVGFSRWAYPTAFTEEQKKNNERLKEEAEERKKNGTSPFPEGANTESLTAMFAGIAQAEEKWVKSENMYVVQFLAVHQDYQAKGIGKMLLRHGLELADAEGKQTYIEATAAGRLVYSKLGWKDIDLFVLDVTKWLGPEAKPGKQWIMMRDPQPAQALQ